MNAFITALNTLLEMHRNDTYGKKQQAYMKSAMPFYGIAKPLLETLAKPLIKEHAPANQDEYLKTCLLLFKSATHREQWYVGLLYARSFKQYINPAAIETYLAIIRHTCWWDIVDVVAPHLIGPVLKDDRRLLHQYCKQWIKDSLFWIQRTALLTQLTYKKATDFKLQAELIVHTAHIKEFFIRKAIGWSLREYAKTHPNSVLQFVQTQRSILSNLSYSQATKHLNKLTS